MKTSKMFIIFMTLCFLPFNNADFCGHHSTLVEIDKFYLTQSYNKDVMLDFSNYFDSFAKLSKSLPMFKNVFDKYDDDLSVKASEPVELHPFNENFNILADSNNTIGLNAYNQCNQHGAQLIAFSKDEIPKITSLMKKLDFASVPFKAIAYQKSLFSLKNGYLEFLENAADGFEATQLIHTRSPPFLTKNGQVHYPIKYKSNNTTETTSSDFVSKILCMKPNNLWDLPENQNNWFQTVPRIKDSINGLEKLLLTYGKVRKVFKSLPKQTTDSFKQHMKLICPKPLVSILKFLDKFSERSGWENSDLTAKPDFSEFLSNTLSLIKHFNFDPKNFLNVHKEKAAFKPLSFDEINWHSILEIDHLQYGINGPITIKPIEEEEVSTKDLTSSTTQASAFIKAKTAFFKANIKAKIFNREKDLITIYKVYPNIVNGLIPKVKFIIKSKTTSISSEEEPTRSDCQKQNDENFEVCDKLLIPPSTGEEEIKQKCISALFKVDYDNDFNNCPTSSPPSHPFAYRAYCKDDSTSSIIINSETPLNLKLTCDSEGETIKEISQFPVKIETDCAVQSIDESNQVRTLVPQLNNDYYQDPKPNNFTITNHVAHDKITNVNYLYIIIITLGCVMIIFLTSCIVICCYAKCCTSNPVTLPISRRSSYNNLPIISNNRGVLSRQSSGRITELPINLV